MGQGRDDLNRWLEQNPGSDPSWAPVHIREGAWAEENAVDYLAEARKKTPGYPTTYGGPGYGRQPDAWLGAAMGGYQPPPSWQRRMALLGFTPRPGKARLPRSLASVFENVPEVRELAINASDFPVTDYETAARRYLATLPENAGADPIAWAVKQGFMPKLPPKTIQEAVDARTFKILSNQGLLSPEMQQRMNQRLEAEYQAEMEGTEPPKFEALPGETSFFPIVPSMQLWRQIFTPSERTGYRELNAALEIPEEEVDARIAALAPPGGGASLARSVFRRL